MQSFNALHYLCCENLRKQAAARQNTQANLGFALSLLRELAKTDAGSAKHSNKPHALNSPCSVFAARTCENGKPKSITHHVRHTFSCGCPRLWRHHFLEHLLSLRAFLPLALRQSVGSENLADSTLPHENQKRATRHHRAKPHRSTRSRLAFHHARQLGSTLHDGRTRPARGSRTRFGIKSKHRPVFRKSHRNRPRRKRRLRSSSNIGQP